MALPYATKEQIARLDALMEEHGTPAAELMGRAGRLLARFVKERYPEARKVLFVCGRGNNGGDGLCASRHLKEAGLEPRVRLLPGSLKPLAQEQYVRAEAAGVEFVNKIGAADVVVDCILGYGITGAARGDAAEAIEQVNSLDAPVVACDVPSGVDSDDGPREPYVKADAILSFALPRQGCKGLAPTWAASIGVPPKLYEEAGLPVVECFPEEIIQIE